MTSFRPLPVLFIALLCVACTREAELPAAQAPAEAAAPVADQNVSELRIGELTAIALKDGGLQFPNDGGTFGVGHSPEEVAKVLQVAGVPTNELALSIQPLFVRAHDRVLLFDTGAGNNMGDGAGKLGASMQQAGIDPASITDIFISHAHGDHVGGLVDGGGALAFPNATIHMSVPEWNFLKGMDEKSAPNFGITNHAALMAAVTPKIDAFAPGSEIIPGTVKAVEIKGHTPGHSGYLITSGADSLLYFGDTAHHYVLSVQEPDWTVSFDGDAPAAQASRKEVIAQSAATGQRIYAVHFPFPGLGKFVSRGEGYVWVPEK